jgi:AcrR family transcriptional regulator
MKWTPQACQATSRLRHSARRERARLTHEALLDAALVRFLEQGYAATTLESIALDAGVSDATIYKSYGGKPGLVRALCERALAGAGPTPAEQRSDALKQREPDPRKVIEGWGRLTAEVAPRVAPILLLLRDAAGADAVAADLYQELDTNRLARDHRECPRSSTAGTYGWRGCAMFAMFPWLYSSPELFDLSCGDEVGACGDTASFSLPP